MRDLRGSFVEIKKFEDTLDKMIDIEPYIEQSIGARPLSFSVVLRREICRESGWFRRYWEWSPQDEHYCLGHLFSWIARNTAINMEEIPTIPSPSLALPLAVIALSVHSPALSTHLVRQAKRQVEDGESSFFTFFCRNEANKCL